MKRTKIKEVNVEYTKKVYDDCGQEVSFKQTSFTIDSIIGAMNLISGIVESGGNYSLSCCKYSGIATRWMDDYEDESCSVYETWKFFEEA